MVAEDGPTIRGAKPLLEIFKYHWFYTAFLIFEDNASKTINLPVKGLLKLFQATKPIQSKVTRLCTSYDNDYIILMVLVKIWTLGTWCCLPIDWWCPDPALTNGRWFVQRQSFSTEGEEIGGVTFTNVTAVHGNTTPGGDKFMFVLL